MKLFRVTLMGDNIAGCNISYCVAEDSGEAYKMVREYMDLEELGYEKDRELNFVELIADEMTFPTCGHRLFLCNS